MVFGYVLDFSVILGIIYTLPSEYSLVRTLITEGLFVAFFSFIIVQILCLIARKFIKKTDFSRKFLFILHNLVVILLLILEISAARADGYYYSVESLVLFVLAAFLSINVLVLLLGDFYSGLIPPKENNQ